MHGNKWSSLGRRDGPGEAYGESVVQVLIPQYFRDFFGNKGPVLSGIVTQKLIIIRLLCDIRTIEIGLALQVKRGVRTAPGKPRIAYVALQLSDPGLKSGRYLS